MRFSYSQRKMAKLFANKLNGDPYQMLHSAASELGVHCLPITLLGVCVVGWGSGGCVSSLQWVKLNNSLLVMSALFRDFIFGILSICYSNFSRILKRVNDKTSKDNSTETSIHQKDRVLTGQNIEQENIEWAFHQTKTQ